MPRVPKFFSWTLGIFFPIPYNTAKGKTNPAKGTVYAEKVTFNPAMGTTHAEKVTINPGGKAMVDNPRAIIGGNFPPEAIPSMISETPNLADLVAAYTAETNAAWAQEVAELLDIAGGIPKKIEDDDTLKTAAGVIKRIRDLSRRLDAHREGLKAPYRAGAAAIDGFFFPLIDKCAQRNAKERRTRPGASDALQALVDDYQARKLAEEQARRRREAEEAAKQAREAAAEAAREAAAAAEAERAAARARAPASVAAKAEAAQEAAREAEQAQIAAAMAAEKAEAARIDTLAKPADLVRTRSDDGAIATMGTEAYAIVEDYDLLDKAALWPFIKRDAIDSALRQWAKTTGHKTAMSGAAIGHRPKTQIR